MQNKISGVREIDKQHKEEFSHLANQASHHRTTFRNIYKKLNNEGLLAAPRGQKIIELQNFSYTLDPYVRFQNFEARKLNLDYIKREFLWYLKGDKFDLSICDHAKIWKTIVNSDGTINSNYGQYVWGQINQFDTAFSYLKHDKDTRRASIVILRSEHLQSDTKDVPCTFSISFRIRENKLNMSVHMRSQDAIYGMGADAPTFSFIHEMMLNALLEFYPNLEYGSYFHIADSFHVYERHFEMLKELSRVHATYATVWCPKMSGPEEVKFLRKCDFTNVPDSFAFTKWLLENSSKN